MATDDGLDCFGCDYVGDWTEALGPLLQAGGGLVKSAVEEEQTKQAKTKAEADTKATVDAVITADYAATIAAAKAAASAKTKAPTADVDRIAAQTAADAQERAASKLASPDAPARVKAAEDGLNAAIKAAQAKPKDVYAQSLVEAWQETVSKATGGVGKRRARGEGEQPPMPTRSWLTRPVIGPVPGWGVLLGGAGVLGGVALAVKKIFF